MSEVVTTRQIATELRRMANKVQELDLEMEDKNGECRIMVHVYHVTAQSFDDLQEDKRLSYENSSGTKWLSIDLDHYRELCFFRG